MNPIGVTEKKVNIEGIPAFLLTPAGEGPYPTMIFYHGWSSCKENQRFRGNVFASYGWQVLLPDAPYHGERGELDYEDEKVLGDYFFKVTLQVTKEFPKLRKFLKEETPMKGDLLFLGGHSMGSIISGGVLTAYPDQVTGAVAYNGCWDWKALREAWGGVLPDEDQKKLEELNPAAHFDVLKDKVFFLGNGESDGSVNPSLQQTFYEEMKEQVGVNDRQQFEIFVDTTHVTTTQMMEAGVLFLDQFI